MLIPAPSGTGAVYTSSNSGATWTNRMSLTARGVSIYENYAMMTLGNNTIYLSNNYGASWTTISVVNGNVFACAISYDNTTSKYIAVCCTWETVPSMYYCTNFTGSSSTTTFTKGTTGISLYDQRNISLVGRNGIALSSDGASYLGIWYTSNGGQTWIKSVNYSTVTDLICCSLSATGLGIALKNGGGNNQYITRDNGVTWTIQTIFPSVSYAFALHNKRLVSATFLAGNNIVYYGTYS